LNGGGEAGYRTSRKAGYRTAPAVR